MSHNTRTATDTGFSFQVSDTWGAYWVAMVRVLVGWWFFHSGFTKLLDSGLNFDAAGYLQGMSGTTLGPVATFLADYPDLIGAMVPIFETLIGLALIAGLLTRLASFGGVVFMSLFWVGNGRFGHGLVNSDFMGLLLFVTMIVFAAGRYYGLDAFVEKLSVVQNNPKLRYILG
ncbi:DoxX family membrane protein [Halobacterium jilantaiense]|uniref:Thiosulfate dehydrogenase [quinone] large subunit n=1 Tax=Halobacterium jilantaiense TaxID=355548 RepID=A0A1I0PNF5_9EURY|nr:DoxX family protein [Halobacterium jilantaiense]SEW15954.1 thiosulfate dehydrogenase [quinone] large subunit [Halobacterium jilantaiense]